MSRMPSLFLSVFVLYLAGIHLAFASPDKKDLSVTMGEACLREVSETGECVQSGGQIQITVKVDSITINSIKVNKGNCQNFVEALGIKQFPRQAKFGEKMEVVVTCSPILIELETDRGSYQYELEQ